MENTEVFPDASSRATAPLDRARIRRDEIERELKKCPDFQLYLLTTSSVARARMERHLTQNPDFKLWRALSDRIGGDGRQAAE
jgi:hypothetical protein